MALAIAFNYKGVSANYWKITKLAGDAIAGTTYVEVSLYYNQAARQADVTSLLDRRAYIYPGTDLTRAAVYALIKADYIDATARQYTPTTPAPPAPLPDPNLKFFSTAADV